MDVPSNVITQCDITMDISSNIITQDNAEECILLGFEGNEDFILALNFSILIAKQYIYYQ